LVVSDKIIRYIKSALISRCRVRKTYRISFPKYLQDLDAGLLASDALSVSLINWCFALAHQQSLSRLTYPPANRVERSSASLAFLLWMESERETERERERERERETRRSNREIYYFPSVCCLESQSDSFVALDLCRAYADINSINLTISALVSR